MAHDGAALMAALIAWIKAARWHKSLSHCGVGLLLFLPIGFFSGQWGWAAWSVVVWYYSRKVAETQLDLKHLHGLNSTVDVWSKGLWPWQWWAFDPYRVLDVLAPAVSCALLAYALKSFM